jgi:transglutaminase-like putative cysteine protease
MARPAGARALDAAGTMPHAPGLAATTPGLDVTEVISLASSLRRGDGASSLPLPYPPLRLHVGGAWRVDPGSLTVYSTDAHLTGLHYAVTGKDVNPSPQQLSHAAPPPAAMAAYLKVPAAFDGLRSLADRITAGQTSAYGKAVALQAWFHRPGNFTYSLTTHLGTGAAALAKFLKKTKSGSCQQFAFGMAVLARLVGIPSRVVIGFTQGTFVRHNTWRVMTTDAHAWPELYFSGAGWLAFEPTPPDFGGPAGQGTATIPAYTDPQQSSGSAPAPQTGQASGSPSPGPTSVAPGAGSPHKPTGPQGGSGGTAASQPEDPGPFWALAAALLAVLLLTPGLTRVIVRRWRWRTAHDDVTRAHVAWRELCDDLADHRIAWQASESPRALARRLAGLLGLTGAERDALERVARAEERASYAASPADSAPLQSDITLVKRAVTRTASRSARWSARIAPPSVLAPAFASLRHALDVFGWIELATTRARAHSPFRRRAPHPHIT